MRYRKLLECVRAKDPRSIVEIGTWNGERAYAMLTLAPGARYYGFDLFEDATDDTDREEMNVKAHHSLQEVQARLAGFDAHLVKGNTRQTLAAFSPEHKIDFVWLDGGHSLETIRSDWRNIKMHLADAAWVLFDDYYVGGIDTNRFGCNKVVEGLPHILLGDGDPVTTDRETVCGKVYIAMVRNDGSWRYA